MTYMLAKRQTDTATYDNDADGDDGFWGYSTVRADCWLWKNFVAHAGADRGSHQMGCRGRYYHTPRTLACLGTHARSTKDQARPASDGIPQGMILQAPLNDCVLKLYSSWSLGNNGLITIRTPSSLQTHLAGVVRDTLCKRILLQVRHKTY